MFFLPPSANLVRANKRPTRVKATSLRSALLGRGAPTEPRDFEGRRRLRRGADSAGARDAHLSESVDRTLPVLTSRLCTSWAPAARPDREPWWLRGRSMDSELVCRLVMDG